jgi:GNAT superfamily N-acetyltransferase
MTMTTQAPQSGLRIRAATSVDVPLILGLIRALADYERLLCEVVATEDGLRAHLFGSKPAAEVVIGEWDGAPVAFALYFQTFSTFLGRPGLYLEDLFVQPAYRGKGIGSALLAYLAGVTCDRGYGRMEWSVLDWNAPALRLYEAIGAAPMSEWTVQRLTGDALKALAARRP